MNYDVFMTRCISMPMNLNGTEHIYTVITRLHGMFYMEFHVGRINMLMSLNATKYMYIITARVHIMFYKASCLDVFRYI
jgi:hypothetical protein